MEKVTVTQLTVGSTVTNGPHFLVLLITKTYPIGHETMDKYQGFKNKADTDAVDKYFENLVETFKDVNPENIVNYEESNLIKDPSATKFLFKRGTRYPEKNNEFYRVMCFNNVSWNCNR